MEKRFDLDGYFGGGGDQPYYTSGYYGGYGGQPTLRKRFDLSGYGGFYDATGSAEKRSSGYRGRDRVIAFL
jgi:hypothetical protein